MLMPGSQILGWVGKLQAKLGSRASYKIKLSISFFVSNKREKIELIGSNIFAASITANYYIRVRHISELSFS